MTIQVPMIRDHLGHGTSTVSDVRCEMGGNDFESGELHTVLGPKESTVDEIAGLVLTLA